MIKNHNPDQSQIYKNFIKIGMLPDLFKVEYFKFIFFPNFEKLESSILKMQVLPDKN